MSTEALLPTYLYGDFRDKPRWEWSRKESAIFRAYCYSTKRYHQVASTILAVREAGVPIAQIVQQGKVSKQYIYFVLCIEKLRARDKALEEQRAKIRALRGTREEYLALPLLQSLGRPIDMGAPRDVWIEGELFE